MNQNNELLRFSLKLFLIFSIGIGGLLHCTTEPIHPVLEFVQSEVIPDSGKVIESPSEPCIPKKEICDGIDNNCDGIIDEVCCFPNYLKFSTKVFSNNLKGSGILSLAFRSDAKEIAHKVGERSLFLTQVDGKNSIESNIKSPSVFKNIIYHPNGKSIFIAKVENNKYSFDTFTVDQYNLSDGKFIRSFLYPKYKSLAKSQQNSVTLAVSPDGKLLAAIPGIRDEGGSINVKVEYVPLFVWSIKDGKKKFSILVPPTAIYRTMVFSLDSQYIGIGHHPHIFMLRDSSNGKLLYSLKEKISRHNIALNSLQVTGIAFHPKNPDVVALASSMNCKITIVNFKKKTVIKELPLPNSFYPKYPNRKCQSSQIWMSVSFSPDGSWLVAGHPANEEALFFWYASNYKRKGWIKILKRVSYRYYPPLITKWSKDSKNLVTATSKEVFVHSCAP